MNFELRLFSLKLWVKSLISLTAIKTISSIFGALWLILEITSFFLGNSPITDKLRGSWFWFLIAGIIIAIFRRKPKLSYECKLSNRDIRIELAIGDLFKYDGALIIGSNTTFDTKISRKLISEKSIQGQFTRKYYGDETQLDTEIERGLENITPQILSGKGNGKCNRYPIGTVVRLNPKERTAYIVAIAQINEYGAASGTFEELKQALASLWLFISQRGLKETIVMPIIGSGFTRLSQSREEIVREIIKSFVAACSDSTFCDKLTIVVTPKDIENNKINMNELEKYITHICKYTTFASNSIQTGIPV
ncbi:MAG: DUF6430 domain-containing protein [Halobacteriota archaeon]|nr:DUF6430 domain-containing protein [Halobacteriota archaeon]